MPDFLKQARALHASCCVIDMHADTPQRFADEPWDFFSPELGQGHISLATSQEGGLKAEFFAAWVEPTEWRGRYAARTRQLIESVHAQVARSDNTMALCTSADDILAANANKKFAALIGVEGGHSIEARLDLLDEFYQSGARYMTLTWSNTNEWADSSSDQQVHNGLSAFGKDVIRAMNQMGMMVDVSHVSDTTFWDVLKLSSVPVVASHSSCRAITASPRNLTDDMMKALADAGGVVCINFFPAFVDEAWRSQWNALQPARAMRHDALAAPYRCNNTPVPFIESNRIEREFADSFPPAHFDKLIAHFEHALDVVGPHHVGIGTDFDGIVSMPDGLNSAADLPEITAALLKRGHSKADLKLVLGENVLRVLRAVANGRKAVS